MLRWRRGYRRVVEFGAVAAISGAALFAGLHMLATGTASSAASALGLGLPKFPSAAAACSARPSGIVGELAMLAPGHAASELSARGYESANAVVPNLSDIVRSGNAVASGTSGPVVIHGGGWEAGSAAKDASSLISSGVVSTVAPLLGQSTTPNYRSCDYRLADSAEATKLLSEASPVMIASGVLTQAQLIDPSTVYMVSDDPFSSHMEFVTVLLERPVPMSIASSTIPTESQLVTPVVAEVEIATGQVVHVGFGNWYLGQ